MRNTANVAIFYPPIGTTAQIVIGTRIRKTALVRLAEVTGGKINASGNIQGARQDVEDVVRELIAQEYPDWTVAVSDERARIQREGDQVKWASVSRQWRTERMGYVGRLQIFKVNRSTTRGDDKSYYLTHTLPGSYLSSEENRFATEPEVEMVAERVLATFLNRLGAELI